MTPTNHYVALSLGWGVQSFTLAAMVALGELPPIDVAIHADTKHERSSTYEFAMTWTPWLEERGVNVATVSGKELQVINSRGGVTIPALTITRKGKGKITRQCTDDWKRAPIRRYLQANRNKKPVELWLGISLDEALRMKESRVKYITHRWPLIEKRMTRNDCANWLIKHDLPVPPKSACIFCPFQSQREWHDLKLFGNGDFAQAVEVDKQIRKARPPWDLFVHPARIPLDEVDLRNAEERGQLSFDLWSEECSGVCGV